jgi:Raf kinase inhibitor-like YbhB/YbcL family protein
MRKLLSSFILLCSLFPAAYAANFQLKSTNVNNGNTIPKLYTCDGGNQTPELHWQGAPAKTQAFAIVGLSYDSPMGKIYGWTVYNIPATVTGLPANIKNLPAGAVLGQNSLSESYYRGPCPGDSALHHYAFIIYALDANLSLDPDLSPKDLMEDIKPHVLQEARLEAVYRH